MSSDIVCSYNFIWRLPLIQIRCQCLTRNSGYTKQCTSTKPDDSPYCGHHRLEHSYYNSFNDLPQKAKIAWLNHFDVDENTQKIQRLTQTNTKLRQNLDEISSQNQNLVIQLAEMKKKLESSQYNHQILSLCTIAISEIRPRLAMEVQIVEHIHLKLKNYMEWNDDNLRSYFDTHSDVRNVITNIIHGISIANFDYLHF